MKKTFKNYIKLTLAMLLLLQVGYSQTPEAQGSNCIGRTVLNSTGGTTANDGLRIINSGVGNLQVYRLGAIQINSNDFPLGTSTPLANSYSAYNRIVLMIGNKYFPTGYQDGSVTPGLTWGGTPTIVSNTCQASVGPDGGVQQNNVRLSVTTGGLTYYLNVIYDYVFPKNFLTITYQVEIPATNTQTVKLAHGFDSYLSGGDAGSGFVSGTAPYLKVGVQRAGAFEAFNYISGVPWSGYYSAFYSNIYTDLGTDGTFNNTINSTVLDNGLGISMNFGSTPGTYSSVSSLSFSCAAPATAPSLTSSSLSNTCPTSIPSLNSLYTGTLASGVELKWYKSTGELYTTPDTPATGSYYAVFNDALGGCTSPNSSTVTVIATACCSAGTTAPTLSSTSRSNVCPAATVNLNSLVTSATPANAALKWFTNSAHTGTAVADPTQVPAGTYYAFYYDGTNNCYSPATAAVTATVTACCPTAAPTVN